MHDLRVQAGGEALDFGGPIGEQRRRGHQQARLGMVSSLLLDQQQRQDLDRLAQAHVVGKACSQAKPGQSRWSHWTPAFWYGRRLPVRAGPGSTPTPSGLRKAFNVSASQEPAVIRDQSATASSPPSSVTE